MKKTIIIILCIIMVLTLAACGSSSSGSSSSAEKADQSQPADQSALQEEQTDAILEAEDVTGSETGLLDHFLADSVVMSASSDGGTFDPHAHSSFTATNLIFQSLLKQDTEGNVRLEMAKNVEQIDDLTWEITIWDNIHDSDGNHITSSDIVFSINRLIETGNESQVGKLDHIEIVDDYTVRWICRSKFALGEMEKQMSDPKIFSEKACNEHDFTTDPVGTGAYYLKKYVPGNSVVIEADENYWMKDLDAETKAGLWTYSVQNVREITFLIVPDEASRAIALETGTIDIADSLNSADASELASKPGFTSINKPSDPPAAFIFNCSDESPFADVNLRKAVCLALDNEAIIAGLNCPAFPVYGISPRMYDAPDSWLDGREYYDFDQAKAEELISQSSYDGSEITLMYSSSTANDGLAIMMQSQLKKAGINVKLYCVENSVINVAMFDPTQWDIRIDSLGGSNYFGKIAYRFSSMDSYNNLHGLNIMLIKDKTLDKLCQAVYDDGSEENINAWDDYFTYEQCYAYAVFGYAEQTACKEGITPGFGMRYAILPNSCSFAE